MPLDIVVDHFLTNCEVRTAQVNQRGRPFDFFVDQFSAKYEERTSQDN